MTRLEALERVAEAAREMAATLNGCFVVCRTCGDQETTTDIDGAAELYAAIAALSALDALPAQAAEPQGETVEVVG